MEIMGLFSRKSTNQENDSSDLVRPEECIRQELLDAMIRHLGYPKEYLCIEKSLKELPHLGTSPDLPDRRIDLLVYFLEENKVEPLLLIECKKDKLGLKEQDQLFGYNYYIKAPFLALVSHNQVHLHAASENVAIKSIHFLPSYKQLITYLHYVRLHMGR